MLAALAIAAVLSQEPAKAMHQPVAHPVTVSAPSRVAQQVNPHPSGAHWAPKHAAPVATKPTPVVAQDPNPHASGSGWGTP
jgi:hypothetical protein